MKLSAINLTDENCIILDTETTGFSKNAEVIELGIIDLDGKVLYNKLFNPGHDISFMIKRITGIRNEELNKAPLFEDEWEKIKRVIEGKIIIGHNIDFDIKLLQQTLNIHRINEKINSIYKSKIDTLPIIKKTIDFGSYKQEDIAKALNVNNEKSHRALNDCKILLKILNKLNNADSKKIYEYEQRMIEVLKEKDPKYRAEKRKVEFYETRKNNIASLCKKDKTIDEIAKEIGVTTNTIEENIITFISNGDMDYRKFLSNDKEQLILKTIEDIGGYTGNIWTIKKIVGDEVSVFEINIAICANDIPIVDKNLIEEKLSLTMFAKNNNLNKDDLLNFLIKKGLIEDIKTITKLGEEYGIEYMYNDGAKWPVYGDKIKNLIDEEMK